MAVFARRICCALFPCLFVIALLMVRPANAAPVEGELTAAAEKGDLAKVKALLADGASPNDRGQVQATALMMAVEGKHNDVVETLLAAGADAKSTRGLGITALHTAASVGNIQAISLLARANADLNAAFGKDGTTPILSALRQRQWGAAKALLAAGANLMATPRGEQALDIAMTIETQATFPRPYLEPDFAQKLIELGAKPDAKTENGSSALLLAAAEQQADMVAFLLQKGSKADEANNKGQTPLLMAAEPSRVELLISGMLFIGGGMSSDKYQEWVRNYEKDGEPPGFGSGERAEKLRSEAVAAHVRRKRALELLLAAGADPNHPDQDGMIPIMAAINSIDRPSLEVLLNAKADPNQPFKDTTALLRVVEDGRIQSVQLLLSHGADPNRASHAGTVPLVLALKKGFRDVAAALKAAGAN